MESYSVLGMKTKQHPHKLSSTTAKFRNQVFRVSRRTQSRDAAPGSSAFSHVTRHKTTMHFANVPTATKARTPLRKVKLYTSVPSPPAMTNTFLSWTVCAAQKSFSLLLGQTKYICVYVYSMNNICMYVLCTYVCMYVCVYM